MAQSQWLNDESQLQEVVYAELPVPLRDLSARIHGVEGGSELLRLLLTQADTLRTADDIAYHLCQPVPLVEKALRGLVKLGLIYRMDAAGIRLFGMTRDPERRRSVYDLYAWQDRWQARLAQLEQAIGGASPFRPNGNRTPNPEFL